MSITSQSASRIKYSHPASHIQEQPGKDHIRAAILLFVLIIGSRIAVSLQVGWIAFMPLFILTIVTARLSPPITGLSLLFGWIVYADVDISGFWLIPRLPTISLLTIWIIAWLIFWRNADQSLQHIQQPIVIAHSALLFACLAIGYIVAILTGNLASSIVQAYIWDILRGWLGYFVVALLSCRNMNDLTVLLIGLPVAALIYPMSLPLNVWQDFLGYRISSSNILGAGLSYGSLNTNTLGQAMGLAGVISFAIILMTSSMPLRGRMTPVMIACIIVTLMTGSRQSLIGLLIGMSFAVILSGKRLAIMSFVLLILSFSFGAGLLPAILPDGSGLQKRLVELTQPPETWESRSYSTRMDDFMHAFERWQDSPIFGVGFGGQSTDVVFLPDYGFELRGTHSLLLGILVQTGLVGSLLFFIFIISITMRFLMLIHKTTWTDLADKRLIQVAIPAAFACILVQQNISGGLGVGSSAMIFFFGALLSVIGEYQSYSFFKTTHKL